MFFLERREGKRKEIERCISQSLFSPEDKENEGNVSLSDRSLPDMQDAEQAQANTFSLFLADTLASMSCGVPTTTLAPGAIRGLPQNNPRIAP